MALEFAAAAPLQRPAGAAYAPASYARRTAERPPALALTPFPELDCVRHRLPFGIVAAAERRARNIGVGADRVLIAAGALDEESYIRALAAHLGVPFMPLSDVDRAVCPIDDERLVGAFAADLLPLRVDGELVLVVAPRHGAARRLAAWARAGRLPERIMLTTSERLQRFIERHATTAIGRAAAETLRTTHPDISAAPGGSRAWWPSAAALVACAAAALAAPTPVAIITGALMSLIFLAWATLRLMCLATPHSPPRPIARQPDDTLPVYTVIVALYREVAVVQRLAAALDALDYPPEKLDVKFVVEADDFATRAALADLDLGPHYDIVVAPRVGPRTKPKALNVALARARGTFTAVFDAEDRPEPDQLRRALDAFHRCGSRLACVQARLLIDNTADGWLARLFTAEYCGQFDVFLPGLAARRLPLPLGGSSNHFRTAVLREVGGWDAYNVTEDADLGVRLARFGYRTAMIASTTLEEAPARLSPWLRQRTRWFKGWLQTWLVHMRAPRRLARVLGLPGFAAFQLMVGGTVVAALIHPLFLARLTYEVAAGPAGAGGAVVPAIYGGALAAGYVASVVVAFAGLARRRLTREAWVLLLVPVLWLMLSLAAWRALIQLFRDPYRWEKTEHGLATTSRSATPAPRLARLQRPRKARLIDSKDDISSRVGTAAGERGEPAALSHGWAGARL